MKKILSIFALFVALGVNAQVVGGYIPINSTKSATMGGLRVNGAITATGTIKTGSTTIQGGGNATVTLPASSGTLANLGDVYFTQTFAPATWSPNDNTTYYFGTLPDFAPNTGRYFRVNLPYSCTLIGWEISGFTNGVIGTSESCTVSIVSNNTSTVTLTNTLNLQSNNAPVGSNGFFGVSGTGIATNYNAGDYIFGQFDAPAFTTNPTSFQFSLVLYFRRQ
jgi:hypothetical protein